MVAGLARANLDAALDAVRTRSNGNLDAVAVGARPLRGGGEVDGGCVGTDVDGVHRCRWRYSGKRPAQNGRNQQARQAPDTRSRSALDLTGAAYRQNSPSLERYLTADIYADFGAMPVEAVL